MKIYNSAYEGPGEPGLFVIVEAKPDRVWMGLAAHPSRREEQFPIILLGWKGKTGDLMQELLVEAEARDQLPQIAIINGPGKAEIGYFLRLAPGNEVWLRKLYSKKTSQTWRGSWETKAILVVSFAEIGPSAVEEFMRGFREKSFFFLTVMTAGTDRYKDIRLQTFAGDVPEFPELQRAPRRDHH